MTATCPARLALLLAKLATKAAQQANTQPQAKDPPPLRVLQKSSR